MKKLVTILAVFAACGTTKDCGAFGVNNSTTAQNYIEKNVPEATSVTCITDYEDSHYLCAVVTPSGNRNFRCADSSDAGNGSKVKCIPWFTTQ